MKSKKIGSFQNLDQIYHKVKTKIEENQTVFEQKIYHDGKQFSCKLPAKMMDHFHYKKGDKLRFTIDLTGEDPSLAAEYVENEKDE